VSTCRPFRQYMLSSVHWVKGPSRIEALSQDAGGLFDGHDWFADGWHTFPPPPPRGYTRFKILQCSMKSQEEYLSSFPRIWPGLVCTWMGVISPLFLFSLVPVSICMIPLVLPRLSKADTPVLYWPLRGSNPNPVHASEPYNTANPYVCNISSS
jgi:hypothetical protein